MTRQLSRGTSPVRDVPLAGWLLAAVVTALGHRWLPDANWLMLHLVLLGAATHAILVWSFHFALTILRAPATEATNKRQQVRLLLLAVGAAGVLVGVPTTWWWLTLTGGILIASAVGWHSWTLLQMLRKALPARFRVTVRYYLAAGVCLLVGVTLGVTLAIEWPDPWHGRLLVAHAIANALGWIGLTVVGTLLTLWPTLLRTSMEPRADLWTRQALPGFLGSIALGITGALLGVSWLAGLGVLGYAAALLLWARALWSPLRKSPPREFAPGSVGAAIIWLLVGLVWAAVILAYAPDWAGVREGFVWPASVLGAGFGAQVLIGALSYLLPSVLGGGPSAVRAGQRWFNAAGGFRLIATNGGLLLWLLPTPSWVKVTGSSLALVAAASFLPLMALGLRASLRVRKAQADAAAEPASSGRPAVERTTVFTSGQLIAGLTAIATAVVVGVGVDPAAAGAVPPAPSVASVTATGQVVRLQVIMQDMRFTPAQVTVNPGDHLIVELVNNDTTTHDLVIGAARSARIAPGAATELDAGVIGESVQGFCSVAGHRQMGMTFDVVVSGSPSAPAQPSPSAATMEGHDHADHNTANATVGEVIDPVLPALTDERVHRLTLTVAEVTLEVAPGVWQRRWTFNGRAPGPILHGRVGDVFDITLVNDGSMGHSIDFHAGSLAPDKPMRTIEPGESLTYRFTATKAGIWMYHCSTMPMSAHIAAGMAGAVVIEPDGLPDVDRSYVVVQSEVYLSPGAHDQAGAQEVNADAAASGQADYVVFNGIANGYDTHPLTAKVGERVRFWVLDNGPNLPSSFHIVGSQFDTVYSEGAYLLKNGRDAFGSESGGSQALGLQPAQGGFVEAVFPEAGRYPMVTHAMADAERGAHGFVQVTG